jgi:hypothetical protein
MNDLPLLPLVAKLKSCPTQDDRITPQRFVETWNSFKQIAPEHGDTVTSAMLVGLVLYDPETFAPLLTPAEREQLIRLGLVAQERYQRRTNPANNLGKRIVASLKESI